MVRSAYCMRKHASGTRRTEVLCKIIMIACCSLFVQCTRLRDDASLRRGLLRGLHEMRYCPADNEWTFEPSSLAAPKPFAARRACRRHPLLWWSKLGDASGGWGRGC